jgi:fused signal recognition particle receptor
MALFSWFKKKSDAQPEDREKTQQALGATRENLWGKMTRALTGKRSIDADFLEELESILVGADLGVDTAVSLIEQLEEQVRSQGYLGTDELRLWMQQRMRDLMPDLPESVAPDFSLSGGTKPYVVLVVGVNGVGKTTTIGKMAFRYAQEGKKVVLGAADTFRAAAVDQLGIWKERTGADIVSMGMGADPASVAFEAIKQGVEQQADVVIVDTAGRLHNKVGLMNELSKIKRVMQKFQADAPHEVVLVIDATTGQNAFEQARQFSAATQVNALAVTKLDGTAKGGVLVGVSHEFQLPVKYVGLGEGAADLRLFDKESFVSSIFES